MKYIIVGGVAGGATAAARLRRLTEEAEIILFEKGKYISYANCGLPYYIGGTIAEREKLLVQTVEGFSRRLNVDVRNEQEVTAIDRKNKTVSIRCADGRTYTESYDKLLLSPGASPVCPPLPGIEGEGIFTLRNVDDTDRIKSYLGNHDVRRALIIGGGFIGLEMAENLHDAGAEVGIVEMADQVMAPVDYSIASIVHSHLLDKGVRLFLKQAVAAFEHTENGVKVRFSSGQEVEADIVILSIGVRANTRLAEEAGIELGKMRGIKVNEYLQTCDPDIYAVGDAIEYPHPLTGKPWLNFLAGPANRQARIVADNMVRGNVSRYEGSIGTSVAKVFDLTVAATGLPAKRLRQWGIDYKSVTVHPNDHAGYYPGAHMITIKLVFDPESGRIYGSQIVGRSGVDKRIDEIAMAIKHNDTIFDLMQVEQAYAPPFSSAKDPVAMAAYVSENVVSGRMKPIYWRELRELKPGTATLIDVRTPDEFALGTLPGAINIPLDEMRSRLDEVPHGLPIVVFCGVGLRGYLAQNILRMNGFDDVRNLIGGLKLYRTATAELPEPKPFGQEKVNTAPAVSGVETYGPVLKLDACGLSCPGPILKLKQKVDTMRDGEMLEVRASDPGFPRDAEAWCETTGHTFLSSCDDKGICSVRVVKGRTDASQTGTDHGNATAHAGYPARDGKTFIMFSDDLDKALATFVLANGAAATGKKVTIFFTFWGLNVIKKRRSLPSGKTFSERCSA